jgi:hypothetical protein
MPFPANGAFHTLGRIVPTVCLLGQPVIVENVDEVGGSIGVGRK